MMTIAVTGGGGYVGCVLIPALLARGYHVRVLDLFVYGRDALPARAGLTVIEGDIRDPEAVSRCVAGAGAVIHLAAVSNDPSCELAPELSNSVNVGGSRLVIDASRRAGAGLFVLASSASVYGISGARPVAESSPLNPITGYGASKCLAEEYLRAAAGDSFQAVALRPAALCGYSPRLRLDLTVNLFTSHAVSRGLVTVFGGTQVRPVLHVRDAARLVAEVLARRWNSGQLEIFNAARENLTVAEIADRVARVVSEGHGQGRTRVEYTSAPADDQRSYAIDSTRARRVLGFTPRLSIDDAVRELRDAMSGGMVPDPLSDDRYVNVRRLKRLIASSPADGETHATGRSS